MWAIISNNCWGAGLYQERRLPFNTPTIGLWFHADDYLKILRDFRDTIVQPLSFRPQSRRGHRNYPVGVIGDGIEIQFAHYRSDDDARTKWNARVARLPPSDDDLYVKLCDRDGLAERHLELFDKLPFRNKVAFLTRGRFEASRFP